MKISFYASLFASVVLCPVVGGLQAAEAAPVKIVLEPAVGALRLKVSIVPERWRQVTRQRWQFIGRFSRNVGGVWTQISERPVPAKNWIHAVPRSLLCGVARGALRIQFQIGIRYRQWWWNRNTRGWSKSFSSIISQEQQIDCQAAPSADIPSSPPPSGTLSPFSGRNTRHPRILRRSTRARVLRRSTRARVLRRSTRARVLRRSTRARVLRRSTRARVLRRSTRARVLGRTMPVRGGFGSKTQPLPTLQRRATGKVRYYSNDRFWRFKNFLMKEQSEQRRVRLIGAWLRMRVAPRRMRLQFNHVRVLLRDFDFALTRYQASRLLSPFLPRPLYARQLARLLKMFSFDKDRVQVALDYCRSLSDPQNLRLVGRAMQFGKNVRIVMAKCRR